ncbi:hypothetical protein [Halobacillus salinus]|uniref:DUF91 domain-containing protein n=1 Tax=Halobacillus salinus TaxID=192814 RepID=A0A4Z0GW70_9BACI|nr:hypothetical protein [Halobacillus salinus]TGB01210.1 hypothetical protein E4663_17175 [Halobacillus salinus]
MYVLDKEKNRLKEVTGTTFFENDLKEREHIQEWIRKSPEVLGEELLIIGCEYDKFEVNERIDLLALDKEGNVTIIELKRDITGSNVDFQALKYASYCARLTPSDVIEIHEDYAKREGSTIDPTESLIEFLEVEAEEELYTKINTNQRIIIAGKNIDKRILSVCTWLYENNIDIKCVTIEPFILNNGEILIDTNQILPPSKLENYYIQKKQVKNDRKASASGVAQEFLQSVADAINQNSDYKVTYNGKRNYFKGRKFLDYPWNFVFAYPKNNDHATCFIESYDSTTVQLIDQIGKEYKEQLSQMLNAPVYLKPGVKNENLLRLVVQVDFNEKEPLEERINRFTQAFFRFKSFLEEKA